MRKITITAIALALCLGLGACADEEGARQTLEDQGYTNIETQGSPWFAGCSEDDVYQTAFSATNGAGRTIHGVVCSGMGWGKASTIRFYR